jgi:TusA-related sulfurtransferase
LNRAIKSQLYVLIKLQYEVTIKLKIWYKIIKGESTLFSMTKLSLSKSFRSTNQIFHKSKWLRFTKELLEKVTRNNFSFRSITKNRFLGLRGLRCAKSLIMIKTSTLMMKHGMRVPLLFKTASSQKLLDIWIQTSSPEWF